MIAPNPTKYEQLIEMLKNQKFISELETTNATDQINNPQHSELINITIESPQNKQQISPQFFQQSPDAMEVEEKKQNLLSVEGKKNNKFSTISVEVKKKKQFSQISSEEEHHSYKSPAVFFEKGSAALNRCGSGELFDSDDHSNDIRNQDLNNEIKTDKPLANPDLMNSILTLLNGNFSSLEEKAQAIASYVQQQNQDSPFEMKQQQ